MNTPRWWVHQRGLRAAGWETEAICLRMLTTLQWRAAALRCGTRRAAAQAGAMGRRLFFVGAVLQQAGPALTRSGAS